MGPKRLFKCGEERSIVCDCTPEEKIIFLGFTQNGGYGNQPQLEILLDSSDVNNSCYFTKQDLVFYQAYLAGLCQSRYQDLYTRLGLCFVLFHKLKF